MTKTIAIKCDRLGCDWQERIRLKDATKWHNAACPKCGHAPVLSDDDMAILTVVGGLVATGQAALADEGATDCIRVDTACLRF